MDLSPYLFKLIELQGSDLFISAGAPPIVKVGDSSIRLEKTSLTAEQVSSLAYSVMNDSQKQIFGEKLELNFALHIPTKGRFRINVFRQRGAVALVARHIKSKIPSLAQLGLPASFEPLICEKHGLILIVGSTGSGKSTTLASMIDYRARNKDGHILTIEDPIEFLHGHQKSLVNQREVGIDTHSYENGLVNALREAPNVIMIGEIRNMETMKHALAYAETGHLCISTLHASNTNQAIDRILNFFPDSAHEQILMDLSLHLKAIIAQRLCKGIEGNRIASTELMANTPYISDLIKKGKIDEIRDAMTRSKNSVCHTFDDNLYQLCVDQKISQDEALTHATSKNNMALQFRLDRDKFANSNAKTKTEVSYNVKAPFEQYRTFSISAIKVSKRRRSDQVDIIDRALIHAFELKGLKQSSQPDIDVQYIYGLTDTKQMYLKSIQNKSDDLIDVTRSGKDASLIINIKDISLDQDVWRVSATRKMSGPSKSQEIYNHEVENILSDFPPTIDH